MTDNNIKHICILNIVASKIHRLQNIANFLRNNTQAYERNRKFEEVNVLFTDFPCEWVRDRERHSQQKKWHCK